MTENTKMPMTDLNLPLSKTCTKCGQIFEALKDVPQMTHQTDEELDALEKRLNERAKEDRQIQSNNETVAVALKGQRLLFDQGFRSQANTFAVRLGLDYENCARKDAQLATDWERAAATIADLRAQLAEAKAGKEKLGRELNLARYGQPDFSWQVHKEALAAANARVKVLEEALQRLLVAADGESYSEYFNAIDDGAAALAASQPADPVTNAGCRHQVKTATKLKPPENVRNKK